MNENFTQIYNFEPPAEMSESEIKLALELGTRLDKSIELEFISFDNYRIIEPFEDGYYFSNHYLENIYLSRDSKQNLKINKNLSTLMINSGTSPFEICHFEKINILFISTNVPIKYLKFPKKRNQIIVQPKDMRNVILAKQYNLEMKNYTIKPKFTFKEYSSIDECQTDNFVLKVNVLKIFKQAKKQGYTELLPFLLEKVYC